jgi:hypothetical protein
MTFLTFVLVLCLFFRRPPLRDWYLVESRTCSDASACEFISQGDFAYEMAKSIKSKGFQLLAKGSEWRVYQNDQGCEIGLHQFGFESFGAAQAYLNRLASSAAGGACQKLFLRKVTGRARENVFQLYMDHYDESLTVTLIER